MSIFSAGIQIDDQDKGVQDKGGKQALNGVETITPGGEKGPEPTNSRDLILLIDQLLINGNLSKEMTINENDQVQISFQSLFNSPEIKLVVTKLQELGLKKISTSKNTTKQSQNIYQLKQKIESEALNGLQNGKPDFNSQKVIICPDYKTTFEVSLKDIDSSVLIQKLNSKSLTGFEISQVKEGNSCQVEFKNIEDVKIGLKAIKAVSGEVKESFDHNTLSRIREKVLMNPQSEAKKPQVAPKLPSFMSLGVGNESPLNFRKHTNSLFVGQSEDLALKEEISENHLSRQRIYSEQVFDQNQPHENVGYQSSKLCDSYLPTAT